jgi:hypothetical protein
LRRVTGKVRTKIHFAAGNARNDTIARVVWIWKRKPGKEGFPPGFKVQRIGVTSAVAISGFPGAEIAEYFREHPGTAKALLGESYDKRYTPSTFISENGDGSFRVGWFTRDAKYDSIKEFQNLADAATDYLLFSLGKGRWTPID